MDQVGDALKDAVLFQPLPLKIGIQCGSVGQPCEDFVIGSKNLIFLNHQLIYNGFNSPAPDRAPPAKRERTPSSEGDLSRQGLRRARRWRSSGRPEFPAAHTWKPRSCRFPHSRDRSDSEESPSSSGCRCRAPSGTRSDR